MKNEVVLKCFSTKNKNYIYDRSTNAIVSIPYEDFIQLKSVEHGGITPLNRKAVERYRKKGLLEENVVRQIKHPATDFLEHYMNNRLATLTLQVTQQCNLRCDYCAFSGLYENKRKHANRRMDFETAKKAMDFYFERNREKREAHISFYGGEPLLEFGLVKQCVQYAKQRMKNKTLTFGMTTNGTLLKDDVIQYLDENKFSVAISLDGSKEEHDANRRFINGGGTFDIIIDNVRNIKKHYPQLDKRIQFITVINDLLPEN